MNKDDVIIEGFQTGKNIRVADTKQVGKVIDKKQNYFIVQFQHYKECYLYSDLLLGDIETKVNGEWKTHSLTNDVQPIREDSVRIKGVY